MECICTAKPAPSVSWFKDDQAVKESGRCKINSKKQGDDYTLTLDISVSLTIDTASWWPHHIYDLKKTVNDFDIFDLKY